MNSHIIMGLFALYAALVSLYLVLSGRQEAVLVLLRRFWGRTLGHALYFVARVAMPLMICVLCLGWGIRQYDTKVAFHSFSEPVRINFSDYRNIRLILPQDKSQDPAVVVYGA